MNTILKVPMNVIEHLACLTSHHNATRRNSESYFQTMRLQPQTFIEALSSILYQDISLDLKKLALCLLLNFVALQDRMHQGRELLERVACFYLQQKGINASAVSKLVARLLEMADNDTRRGFTECMMGMRTPHKEQDASTVERCMKLLMEVYDDSQQLVLPLDCQQMRQLVLHSGELPQLRKILIGVLAMHSVRTKFKAPFCLQLHEMLDPEACKYNKAATLSSLISYLEAAPTSAQVLTEVHKLLQSLYLQSLEHRQNHDAITLLARLASLVFKLMTGLDFDEREGCLRKEYVIDYLIWAYRQLSVHEDVNILYKELLSVLGVFFLSGCDYMLTAAKQHFVEMLFVERQKQHPQPYEWKSRNALYMILAALTNDCAEYCEGDSRVVQVALKDLQSKQAMKLGVLELLLAYAKKHNLFPNMATQIQFTVEEELGRKDPPTTTLQFHTIIKILFCFQDEVGDAMLHTILECTHVHDDDTRMALMECLEEEFENVQIDDEMLLAYLDTFSCYQFETPSLRQVMLRLLAILLNQYPKDNDCTVFEDVYITLGKIQTMEVAEVDSFCDCWCQLLKAHNTHLVQFDEKFLTCTSRLLELFLNTASSDRLAEFLMEMIDLPLEDIEVTNSVRDLLISRLPYQDQKLYDLLEVYLLLYPVTARTTATQILRRLENHTQYYRMCFRLPPGLPFKMPTFCPTKIVEVKWVLLSALNSQGKLKDFQLSKENTVSLEQLAAHVEKLSIHDSIPVRLREWISLLQEWKDNTTHWLGRWSRTRISRQLQKDFLRLKKHKLLELLGVIQPPMEIDY